MTDSSHDDLQVTASIAIPRDEIAFEFSRSSGPGGQNVNKVASKARLRWNVVASPSLPDDVKQRFLAANRSRLTDDGEILISGQRYRDQPKNVADCLERLRALVAAAAIPPKKRRPTKPSRGSKLRRLDAKRRRASRKQDRRTPGRDD